MERPFLSNSPPGRAASDPSSTFDDLYRLHAQNLKRVAFLITGSDAAAEDAVHEVFIRCAGRLEALDHPLSYLRTAVVNECRSQHARKQRALSVAEVKADSELPHEALETIDALQTLDERKRTAIVLRYFIDVPDQEIATILGCRPSTVRSLVHRALIELREVLA